MQPSWLILQMWLQHATRLSTQYAPSLRRTLMKAIQYSAYGSYEENRLVDLERPSPKENEVLVAMRTAGVNPLDNTFRAGHIYLSTPQNLPRVGGQTGVGVVVES